MKKRNLIPAAMIALSPFAVWAVQTPPTVQVQPIVHLNDMPIVVVPVDNLPPETTTTTAPVAPFPYGQLCRMAGSYADHYQFVEETFVYMYVNNLSDEVYEATRDAIWDIIEGRERCDDPHAQWVIETSRDQMSPPMGH